MLDEITYPFPNCNDYIVDVWKRISDLIPHFTGHVITYPYCLKLIRIDLKKKMPGIVVYPTKLNLISHSDIVRP